MIHGATGFRGPISATGGMDSTDDTGGTGTGQDVKPCCRQMKEEPYDKPLGSGRNEG